LGPSPAYGAALRAATTTLNTATQTWITKLGRARTADGQAKAARQLATAYDQAADTLSPVNPGPGASTAGTAVTAVLSTLGGDYTRLAHAAAAQDARMYEGARRSTERANQELAHALAQLTTFGYEPRAHRS
jgi:hypothetical protein